MGHLEKMKVLIKYLPEKDIPIAEKFISKRDFESLEEIVDSDITKVRKDSHREESEQKYSNIDIDKLYLLKAIVSGYLILINGENNDDY